jgi:winged helix DNA-binding protein
MARRGIVFEARSQGPIHLIALAAMRGVLVYGPEREGEETFVLLEDWIGAHRPVSPEKSASELARRYLLAHAPADVADFAAWSGLPMGTARDAAAAEAPLPPPSPLEGKGEFSVRLLPAFDEYLLGYASRAFAFSPDLERRLQRGGGWIHPAVIAGGRGIGSWRGERSGRRLDVTVEALEPITAAFRSGIETEVSDLGRYLGLPARLSR